MVNMPAAAMRPQSKPGGADGPRHCGDNRFGFGDRQSSGEQQFDPGLNIKQKNAVTPTPALIRWQEDGDKKTRKAVAVDKCGLIDFPGNTGHESFQHPDSQGYIEQGSGPGPPQYAYRSYAWLNRTGNKGGEKPPGAPCGW